MDERRVADYFVVAGLPLEPEALDEITLAEGANLQATNVQPPITDISVIFPSLGEKLPEDWEAVTKTPTGLLADLNHGSLRTIECFLCYRRGRDKPPLVDIGVMYDGKEYLLPDAEVVKESIGKHVANVNNSTSNTFITFRRGHPTMPCNALVVTDVCVVIASKGESPPHAFCCISKNLNKGIVGSDVFLCYKKSMNRAKSLTYKPAVLSRYPMGDLPHFPFPNSVPLFCLPMGSTLELWPKQATQPKPVFSTFVLTVSDAKYKVYGSAVTFYERFPEERLTDQQRDLLGYEQDSDWVLNANKSICVLSHWPFGDAFEAWLLFLHNTVASGQPCQIPIERYIVQLFDEVPFPSPRTLLQLTDDEGSSSRVIMTQPEDLPLPRSAAGFRQLLLNLGSENCLQVLLLILTEQKILIHSLRPDTLTAVAEAVSSLLFPFKWQCPYIPLCPLGLVEVLHAPLPFLIGVDSRFFDLYDPPPDVSCIDLDTNIITVAESQRHNLNLKLLPKKAAKSLKSHLDYLYYQMRNQTSAAADVSLKDSLENEFSKKAKEQTQELEIQEAFLRFMALTLKGYRSYLLPITKAPTVGTTDPEALFQLGDFLKSRDKSHHKFFTLMMRTQMFIRFIEERSFVADGDQGLAFFDECLEKMSYEEGDFKLIELDSMHKSDRTIFVLPPEPLANSNEISYPDFTLNEELMRPRKRHLLQTYPNNVMPGSPMARRTKHEIKSAQKLAKKCINSPEMWARCLCGTCHTLYFMVLPSMLSLNEGKEKAVLQQAYELLVRATKEKLACDEVCYRLMMQLCGEHNRPLLAVKLLLLMKKFGIQPNALTYGLYNRCVLEAEWPAHSGSSQLLWNKLRNVLLGAAHFRWAGKQRAASRKLSASTEGGSSLLSQADRTASRSSLDSHEAIQTNESFFLNRFKRMTSIVRGSLNGSAQSIKDVVEQSEEEAEETEEERRDAEEVEKKERTRLLSRSESAGDANIIDKLQENKKNCSRTLTFNGDDEQNALQSPGKMSPRTVVTQNDPLGALEQPPTPPPETPTSVEEVPQNRIIMSDDPVLFKSSVHKSATFDGSPPAQNKIHRSETVPASTVASSLASLGSTFKMGFSRYSPSRLSLRKADLKVPQQLIENAFNNLSPSSLTGKKSNELIQGGLSSIKSAANSVVKKLDEIKEAISTSSANSTPVKVKISTGAGADRTGSGDAANSVSMTTTAAMTADGECESTDGSEGQGERYSRRVSAELSSYRGSYSNLKDSDEPLPDSLFPPPNDDKQDSELEISMTSCSQCHNCNHLLYDEDIMANWFAEDSNLNTICQSCHKPTVPFLTTIITGKNTTNCDPFSVPYLNPLVLRKELENILGQEGEHSLADSKFVDEHPIIYWNLVWAFERINVQTHLPNLYLKKNELDNENGNAEEELQEDTDPLHQELAALEKLAAQVYVRCLWDEPRFHAERPPMYVLWKQHENPQNQGHKNIITKSFMQKIIYNIRHNDLSEPLKSLAAERESQQQRNDPGTISRSSVYRDILFLACKVLGRAQIDLNAFDKEYTTAYSRVAERKGRLYGPQDKPISLVALYCRQFFRPLTLP